MAARQEPCVIVLRGKARDIAFYLSADGKCQVDIYLGDPKRERESKVFYKLAKRLADQGSISSNQQFRHENGEIW